MSHTLSTLLQHAERARDAAMAALLQAEDALRALREQSAQLFGYRAESLLRSPTHGGRSAPIALLRCHRDFMQRLDQALGQLQAQTESAERRSQTLRAELVLHETRVASVRKLIERRNAEAQRIDARQDQRRTDEAAQQRAWRDRAEAQA